MFVRIGSRRRNGLVVLALISLATIGACHKSATDPYDPEQSELRPAQSVRAASAGAKGAVVAAGWNLAQNKKSASMLGSTIGSTIAAIGEGLTQVARK